jgi:hypothetical protein
MIWSAIIAKVLTTVMSWVDAGNLRTRMYRQQDQIEMLLTVLEDIERMSREDLVKQYIKTVITDYENTN